LVWAFFSARVITPTSPQSGVATLALHGSWTTHG